MIEINYIGFGNIGGRILPQLGTVVTRLTGSEGSKKWHQRHVILVEVKYPAVNSKMSEDINSSSRIPTPNAAGQDGLIAFCCSVKDQSGVILMFPDDTFTFLPIEEPSGGDVVRIAFADGGQTLILLYHYTSAKDVLGRNIYPWYETRFLQWSGERRLSVIGTVKGWFVHADARSALLVGADGMPFSYSFERRRPTRGFGSDANRERRFAALLIERKSPRVAAPGTSLSQESDLPLEYAISPDLSTMFETSLDIHYPDPNNGSRGIDPSISKALDAVFRSGRGIQWSMTRKLHLRVRGFQFTRADGMAFRFLSPGTFYFGYGMLLTYTPESGLLSPSFGSWDEQRAKFYPAGIYSVNLIDRSVRRTALPTNVRLPMAEGAQFSDIIQEVSASYDYTMMRYTSSTG